MKEIFVTIKGFDNYKISNMGNVMSYMGKNPHLLKPFTRGLIDKYGNYYVAVRLVNNSGQPKDIAVHRLVAEAFIPNPQNKPQVNHKDGCKHNNVIENLEWVTQSENIAHMLHQLNFIEKWGKPVHQYNRSGKYIKSFRSTRDAGIKLKIDSSSIAECANGKRKTAGGFIWSYEKTDMIEPFKDERPLPIVELNKYGEIINRFDSASQASKYYGISAASITGVCKKRRGYKICKGFIFRYADDSEIKEIQMFANSKIGVYTLSGILQKECKGLREVVDFLKADNFVNVVKCCLNKRKITYGKKIKSFGTEKVSQYIDGDIRIKKQKTINIEKTKKVYQYNLKGEFVRRWDNAKTIQNELKINQNGIFACCNERRKSFKGYMWSYEFHEKIPRYKRNDSNKEY